MKKSVIILLKVAVTAGLLGWLVSKIQLGTVVDTVRMVPPAALGIAALLIVVQALIAAIRWHFIIRYLSVAIPFVRTLQVFWIGQFATALLPGGVAGDGVRMWVLARAGTRPSKCVNSVLLDRVAALTGLSFLVAVSLPFVDDRLAATPIRYSVAGLLVAAIAAGLAVGLHLRLPARWQHFRAVRALLSLSEDLHALCLPLVRPLGLVGLSAFAIVCNTLTTFVLVRSLGVPIKFSDCVTLGSIVILITTLPISLGGWGLREGSMVGLFALIGVAPAVSLSVSVMLGLLSTLVALPGALVWLEHWRATHAMKIDPRKSDSSKTDAVAVYAAEG